MMKQVKKAPIQSTLFRNLLAGAIALSGLVNWQQSAIAEGSRELVKNGGSRPYTEWRTDSTSTFKRRTILKVYANAGEVINLGSSAVGVGTNSNILLFSETDSVDSPSTAKLNCKTAQSGKGILDTRAKEIAGPLPASGGYTPCTYTVPTTGVYQVVFYGPTIGSGAGADPVAATNADDIANPWIDSNQKSSVAMWDITVRSSATSTVDLNGRVFSDYVSLNMGSSNRYLKSELFILTQDGYRYSTNLGVGSGLDPYGFIFFSNSLGLLSSSGSPLYATGKLPLAGGITLQQPVHRLFFNAPSTTAVDGLGVPLMAIAPSPASNFMFTGGTGGSGNQTPQGVGGTFSFDAPQSGSYQIIIDTNNNGTYSSADGDRVLEGKTNSGFNTVSWDGKNGDGTVLPPLAGNAAYPTRIVLRGGEYHFPLIDVESGKDGFKIQMLNPPGGFSTGATATTVYFDERNYTTNGTSVTLGCSSPTVPICDGRAGVDSASGAHKFGTNTGSESDYGDQKVIDTWIYFPSSIVTTPLVVTTANKANVQGKKAVRFLTDTNGDGKVTVGDQVEYTITYSNSTPAATSDATSFVINDTLPSQLTFSSAAIVSQTAGNTITLNSSYGGSGALTNTGTLRKGDTITIKIVATINSDNGGSAIANQASATFSTPDNPGSTVGTVISDADAAGATANPPSVSAPFFQAADNGVNSGNDPTSTADDDPTLINVVPVLSSSLTADKSVALVDDRDKSGGTIPLASQTATPGDILEYTIAVSNTSTTTSANNVVLTDAIPTNTTYVPSTLQISTGANSGAKTDASADDQAEISGSQITFRLGTGATAATGGMLGTTAADKSATVKFRVQINDPLPNGVATVSNQAIVSSAGVANVNSNDPSTPTAADPTVTTIGPRLRLVKRITGVTKATVGSTKQTVGGYNDLATDPNDNASGWAGGSAAYLLGAITGSQIPAPNPGVPAPKDEVEYTIYFLSDGAGTAQNASICDFVPVNQSYVPGSLELNFNGTTTAIADGSGTGLSSGFYTANFPTACQGTNNSKGAAYFQIGNVTSVNATPASSYGFVRFRAKID
ncbi:MAG: DUF11 domain-containing protein [Myxacorys californica WJT36-NPBG1]|jgi:uncharacterized repeat protein (TIGR01451 family)/fimbrial isopeptide formation D2 family protein|nr:DUF11 domain-containing protein [Myxacorys californica WJT36-NPBG1]